MFSIQSESLVDICGGAAIMTGGYLYVTDKSSISMQGLKFLSDSICQNDVCSNEMFSSPMTYTLSGQYNGKNIVSITGVYIEGGARYSID
jgi:hypothetical protein